MTDEHAVVLGAGIGGLLAARVLSGAFARVTLVERDPLPEGSADRPGIPQGRHAHALLGAGQQAIEELFPGFAAELLDAGAVRCEAPARIRMIIGGHPLARVPAGRESILAGRPLLEAQLRRRVRRLPNVVVTDGTEATGVLARGGRVEGVRLGAGETDLRADLVVDAMGRGGRTPHWLAGLGYPRPAEEKIKVGVTYASRHLRLPAGALSGDLAVNIGARPDCPRALALFAQEGDRYVLTLAGYAGERPPSDSAGLLAFAEPVAPPDVLAALRSAEPLDEIVTHHFPAYLRRRYERLPRFPEGLLVFGDAICSFNPVYGQGMSVAALEAHAMKACLGQGLDGFAPRFFQAAARIVDTPWRLAAGADLNLPVVGGHRPVGARLRAAYLERYLRAAERDGELAIAFARVSGLLDPPSKLLRPALVRRVCFPHRAVSELPSVKEPV